MNEDGELTVATEIPLAEGSLFGWRIKLPSCPETIEVREELRLPGSGDWDRADGLTISPDGQTAVVRTAVECHDGWITKVWSVATGDPPGEWVFRVHVKGYAPVTFGATFAPPAPPSP